MIIFREEIKTACRSAEGAMVVSFGRKVLKQTGAGHFAPVGKLLQIVYFLNNRQLACSSPIF